MMNANDIEVEAMEWLVRLDALESASNSDDLSNAARLRAEFDAWCEADTRRHAAYLRLKTAWIKADHLKRLLPADGAVDLDILAPAASKNSNRRANGLARSSHFSGWRMPIAAAIACLAVGIGAWLAFDRFIGLGYVTAVGGFQRLLLTDGSTVELDTDSRIRVHMTDGRRRIVLLRGRANFKVATDARRPFEVEAAATTVRALGTSFSVRLRDRQQIEVLVTEGRVAVVEADSSDRHISKESSPILSAGQAALIKPRQLSVQPSQVAPTDIERQLAWIHGRLTFDGQTLEQAVNEFNRYNPRALVIADPAIAGIKVGGSFQPTDPQSFISALEKSFGVKVEAAGTKEVRLTRAQ